MVTQQAAKEETEKARPEFLRVKPYVRVPQIVLAHPRWTHAQMRIALYLIGRCVGRRKPLGISKDVIAHWTNTSRPTVEEALEYFASDDPSQRGWLTIHRGGRGLRNQYTVDVEKLHSIVLALASHLLDEEVEYIEPTPATRRRKAAAPSAEEAEAKRVAKECKRLIKEIMATNDYDDEDGEGGEILERAALVDLPLWRLQEIHRNVTT